MGDPLPNTWAELEAALLAEQRRSEVLRERLRQREVEFLRLKVWVDVAACRTCRVHRAALKPEPVNSVPDTVEPDPPDRSPLKIEIDLD